MTSIITVTAKDLTSANFFYDDIKKDVHNVYGSVVGIEQDGVVLKLEMKESDKEEARRGIAPLIFIAANYYGYSVSSIL